MSDYRYQLVKHNDIDCLHVMIDGEPITECHIPLDDILEAAIEQGCITGEASEQKKGEGV